MPRHWILHKVWTHLTPEAMWVKDTTGKCGLAQYLGTCDINTTEMCVLTWCWSTFEFKVCTKIIVDSFNANACECKVLQKSLDLLTHSPFLSWVCKSSTVHLPSIVHWKNYLLSSNQESVEIRVFLIEQCIEDFNYHIITHYVNFPLNKLILFWLKSLYNYKHVSCLKVHIKVIDIVLVQPYWTPVYVGVLLTGGDFGWWRRNQLPEAMSVYRRQTQGKTLSYEICVICKSRYRSWWHGPDLKYCMQGIFIPVLFLPHFAPIVIISGKN